MEHKKRQIDTVLEELKAGVKNIFSQDSYQQWLQALAHFHHYSLNNTLLIAMQMPEATHVASIRTWNQLKRKVKAGSHGIRILVPTPVRVKAEDEEQEEKQIMRFKVGHVFDVSQVEELPDAPPLTPGIRELEGDVDGYDCFLKAIKTVSSVPVRFDKIPGEAKGYYDPVKQEIVIRPGMSPAQTAKTCLHELVHAELHNRDRLRQDGGKTRETKEVEAESTAHVCMLALLGEDSSSYSYTYIATWSSGKDVPELVNSLQTIHDTAVELISRFEKVMREDER